MARRFLLQAKTALSQELSITRNNREIFSTKPVEACFSIKNHIYFLQITETKEIIMSTIKDKMIHTIRSLPEDSTYDEILQELSFINMVNKGLMDSKEGKVISTEELKQEIKNW
jgi:predicted transcriptional regulator